MGLDGGGWEDRAAAGKELRRAPRARCTLQRRHPGQALAAYCCGGTGAGRGKEISPTSEELHPRKSRFPRKAVSQPTHGAAAGNHRQTRIPKLEKK